MYSKNVIKRKEGENEKLLASLVTAATVLTLTACGSNNESTGDTGGSSDKVTVWAWDETFNIKAVNEAKRFTKTRMLMWK